MTEDSTKIPAPEEPEDASPSLERAATGAPEAAEAGVSEVDPLVEALEDELSSAEDTDASVVAEPVPTTLSGRLREVAVPLGTLLFAFVVLSTFSQVLLPFIFAVVLVYLMEPLIRLVARGPGRPRGMPRWAAVLCVYATFIVVFVTSLLLVVPTFVAEFVRFAEEAPRLVTNFRTEHLPGINQRGQEFLRDYLPVRSDDHSRDEHFKAAVAGVSAARTDGAASAAAFAMAITTVEHAAATQMQLQPDPADPGSLVLVPIVRPPPQFSLEQSLTSTTGWVFGDPGARGLVLTPMPDGSTQVRLHDVAVEVSKQGESSWVLRERNVDSVPFAEDDSAMDIEQIFDLEERLDDLIHNLVSTSNERLAAMIAFAQRLVIGVVGALVITVLTLMVAAFMSIDLPRIMGFFRSLVPRRMRTGYAVLLDQMDQGLAGVVRGQLLICVVNGILTYIGLYLIDIKFRVLLAVIAGVLSLIPVFGTVLSTIPIVIIGLTQGLTDGVLALLWILGIHALEANFLNPKIIGTSAHIHPVIVIFALLAGESAYGLVGALLAVPTASILLTLFNFVRTRAWAQVEAVEPSS